MTFYEFFSLGVKKEEYDYILNLFQNWMEHIPKISWETSHDRFRTMEGMIYNENSNTITEGELQHLKDFFTKNNLQIYLEARE